jgi:DNA-binding CsgD family transcriptional regulator
MSDGAVLAREMTEVAASADPLPRRAEQLLAALRRVVPFEGAWLALADLHHPAYTTLASADLTDSIVAFLESPAHIRDVEVTGSHRAVVPIAPSDLPSPVEELPTWADQLLPAGYRDSMAVSLFAPGRRRPQVGYLALLTDSERSPLPQARPVLARITATLAFAIDPLRSLTTAAGLVQGARGGVVLHAGGEIAPLPGLDGHALLAADSPALVVAREHLAAGWSYTSFLWPLGGRHAPQGHLRITAMAPPADLPLHLTGLVLTSPPGDLRGLTPRELEVLGLLVEGASNAAVARALVVAPRTVAAHLEHILVKLAAPSRTLAAVRAEQAGLFVPPSLVTGRHGTGYG